MKILFFAKKFYSPDQLSGGMENHLYNLILALRDKHQIILLTSSKYNCKLKNVTVYRFYEIPLPILCVISSTLSLLLTLPFIVLKEKPDLISAFIPSIESTLIFLMSKIFKIKKIINLRGFTWKKNEILTILFGGLTFPLADAIILNSKDLLTKYLDLLLISKKKTENIPCFFLPNGINTDYWSPTFEKSQKEYDLVFIANLHSRKRIYLKGFNILHKSIELIKERYNYTVKVLVIGKIQTKLMNKVFYPFNQEYYNFTGYIFDKKELKRLIQQSKIYVLSSNSEGMPNSLMEAMSLSIPSIATNVGAVNELIEDNFDGFMVPKNDHTILAEKIWYLLNNDSLQKVISIKARKKMIEHFSWDNVIKRVQNYYRIITSRI